METKSSEVLTDFLNFVRTVKHDFDYHYGAVNDCDKATCDIKHQIELGPAKDRNKAATALRKILKERRQHKDYVDINTELVNYFNEPEFIKVSKRLEQLLGVVRKQENYVEGQRVYIPRSPTTTLNINIKERE